jgi:hypothetical protein
MSDFYNQGAVPVKSPAYIPRAFEKSVYQDIANGRWVLLLGPRQHGKSTGLVRLAAAFREAGLITALADLQGLPPYTSFPALLSAFADQLERSLGRAIARPKEGDRGNVAAWLEAAFPAGGPPVVVIVDEAASIDNTDYRNAFYGQIRQISSDRAYAAAESISARIRFVFAGTFRPDSLVQQQNSPFNVCQLIETDDVSLGQAQELAKQVNPAFSVFVEKAHAALNGQPYLLQTVFQETSRRTETPIDVAFNEALADMQRLAGGHLEGIFSKIVGNPVLSEKVSRMVREGATDLIPADGNCNYLQVLGLAKRQGNKLVFRNTLYAEVAKNSPQIMPPAGPAPAHASVFGIQPSVLGVMKNADFRTVCFSAYDGAVKAHAVGSYRLALAGFGSATEALLIDFLAGLAAADLQKAVAAAEAEKDGTKRANFNGFEPKNDVTTWRLVNLINVARKVKVKANAPEPPHALREWRNLIHPALAVKGYLDEAKLVPDSLAAASLFLVLLRDISP